MEKKIREYVQHYFRNDRREDIDSLINEIIANLLDKYHHYLQSGDDEETAYVNTIKSMGDFFDQTQTSSEYNLKPTWADVALVVSIILGVFSVVSLVLASSLAYILIILSIGSFGAAAYFLYASSQYALLQDCDVLAHNLLLKKLFKYLKSAFISWTISLSVMFGQLLASIVFLIQGSTFASLMLQGGIWTIIVIYSITFFLSFGIFIALFYLLYLRLRYRYTDLTGETTLKSHITDVKTFLYMDSSTPQEKYDQLGRKILLGVNQIIHSKGYVLILSLLLILSTFFMIGYFWHYSIGQSAQEIKLTLWSALQLSDWSLIAGLFLGYGLVLVVLILNTKQKRHLWFLLVILMLSCYIHFSTMQGIVELHLGKFPYSAFSHMDSLFYDVMTYVIFANLLLSILFGIVNKVRLYQKKQVH
ncbi:MAG: hypothetical protein U1C51_06840 [Candidatus Izemoplasmatales bacterium]|nr:hypothetical protein [bacterium]MDZ4196938.1 hypothetical protein [Candidatus Izemoplasmatales bacterium]